MADILLATDEKEKKKIIKNIKNKREHESFSCLLVNLIHTNHSQLRFAVCHKLGCEYLNSRGPMETL